VLCFRNTCSAFMFLRGLSNQRLLRGTYVQTKASAKKVYRKVQCGIGRMHGTISARWLQKYQYDGYIT
ncbi:MAG: hypothetical protein ACSHXL_07130, partial [Bacteroidota bacterium]